MRLYQSSKGQWVGTQRDAQKNFPRDWTEVDVPTSKAELIDWLNLHEVGASRKRAVGQDTVTSAPSTELHPEEMYPHTHSWVQWAYETLKRGNKAEAEELLLRGLEIQNNIKKARAA